PPATSTSSAGRRRVMRLICASLVEYARSGTPTTGCNAQKYVRKTLNVRGREPNHAAVARSRLAALLDAAPLADEAARLAAVDLQRQLVEADRPGAARVDVRLHVEASALEEQPVEGDD